MTTDELKQLLNSYRWMKLWADRCIGEITQLLAERQATGDSVGAQVITGMPFNSAGPSCPTERCVERVMHYDRLIETERARMQEYTDARSMIRGMVAALPSVEREILDMRYLRDCCTWDEISEALHRNSRWTMRLHDQAIVRIMKHMEINNITKSHCFSQNPVVQ